MEQSQEKPGMSFQLPTPSGVILQCNAMSQHDMSQHTQSIANQGNSPQTWFSELLLGVDHVDIPDDIPDDRCS